MNIASLIRLLESLPGMQRQTLATLLKHVVLLDEAGRRRRRRRRPRPREE
jgi:hypothetical protein